MDILDILKAFIDIDGYSFSLGYFVGFGHVFYIATHEERKSIITTLILGAIISIIIVTAFI